MYPNLKEIIMGVKTLIDENGGAWPDDQWVEVRSANSGVWDVNVDSAEINGVEIPTVEIYPTHINNHGYRETLTDHKCLTLVTLIHELA